MSKHPLPSHNEARAGFYFFQAYIHRLLADETVTLPNEDRLRLIARELQQVVLSLIPDDDQDAPPMGRG